MAEAPFASAVRAELESQRARHNPEQPLRDLTVAHVAMVDHLDGFFRLCRRPKADQDWDLILSKLVAIGAMAQRVAEDLDLVPGGRG